MTIGSNFEQLCQRILALTGPPTAETRALDLYIRGI